MSVAPPVSVMCDHPAFAFDGTLNIRQPKPVSRLLREKRPLIWTANYLTSSILRLGLAAVTVDH